EAVGEPKADVGAGKRAIGAGAAPDARQTPGAADRPAAETAEQQAVADRCQAEVVARHERQQRPQRSAAPMRGVKVRPRSFQSLTRPANVSQPSSAAAANIQSCATSSRRRRSTISARAPAGGGEGKKERMVSR